jgi:superfamily II DNA helicase RecQ
VGCIRKEDCITIAATGLGKTLTFCCITSSSGYIIVVTALNILGDQNVNQLKALSVKAVNMTSQNTTPEMFKVCLLNHNTIKLTCLYNIENGVYHIIIVSPEKILKGKRFDML